MSKNIETLDEKINRALNTRLDREFFEGVASEGLITRAMGVCAYYTPYASSLQKYGMSNMHTVADLMRVPFTEITGQPNAGKKPRIL